MVSQHSFESIIIKYHHVWCGIFIQINWYQHYINNTHQLFELLPQMDQMYKERVINKGMSIIFQAILNNEFLY